MWIYRLANTIRERGPAIVQAFRDGVEKVKALWRGLVAVVKDIAVKVWAWWDKNVQPAIVAA